MSSVITLDFEHWKAQEAATGSPVVLDEFVFANVPGLDPALSIDRNEKLPLDSQIVHRQMVNKIGLASENAVAYSVTIGTEVGDFEFNWIGLLNKATGIIAMITHAPLQKKIKTHDGLQGNVLTRSFLLEFEGAAKETAINTTAETWQIDFTARLSGIDEQQRLINVDTYGDAAFFDESFLVSHYANQYTVKRGLAYVGGLRGELKQDQIFTALRDTHIYADFSFQGNLLSQWETKVKITPAKHLSNYVDIAGFQHFVFSIAHIDADGNITDLRVKKPTSSLNEKEIVAIRENADKSQVEYLDKGVMLTNVSYFYDEVKKKTYYSVCPLNGRIKEIKNIDNDIIDITIENNSFSLTVMPLIEFSTKTFSALTHQKTTIRKNAFNSFNVESDKGTWEFVTSEILTKRNDKKLSGYGYPENNDFSSSLIKSLNYLSVIFIDVPVYLSKDTVIDCTKIKALACNIESDKSELGSIKLGVDCRLFLKTPRNIDFNNILIRGEEPTGKVQRVRTGIWASNFNGLSYNDCKFVGFGDPINYTSGTCAVWFMAQATTSVPDFIATGNSIKGRVTSCEFEASGDRTTNFAVRAYTPFDSKDATCSDVIVSGSKFTGYNWNAVEFGGLGVQHCKMFNNNAYKCGLTAFDLDKGCSYCEVSNCIQDGVLGNINTDEEPNTNAVAFHIQGVNASEGYAHHNKITNCHAIVYLSDAMKYPNDVVLATSSYAYSNEIRDISLKVIYDIPKADFLRSKKKIYATMFDTITDTVFNGIKSNFFTHGIFQFSGTHKNLYPVAPVHFLNYSSDEELTGEYINIQRGVSSANQGRFICDELNLATNMSNSDNSTPIVFDVQGSSTHLLKIENCEFMTSGAANLVSARTSGLCMNNVYEMRDVIQDNAVISPNSVLNSVAVTDVYTNYGRVLFDMANFDIFENQDTLIGAYINDAGQFAMGDFVMKSNKTTGNPCNISASRVRGYATIMSPLGISSEGRLFRSWVNIANLWRLTHEVA
ncbi:phage tail-collar fiber domain-containing protein [Providencia hangzhouensis]